ncbi:hypothetical protein [Acanthopleuribacter pedis]|uniref:Uncharacterized protein n=1 Tax=Acanthopleuribacter pedis TaxID=442870 RepID=A0A8J7QFH8_9BACT|nr:hypothetical protein [Acanthopleuribacter pedis]MBO1323394.1 hypothetical protein [Acanthopleuribacter pedis]
MVRTVQCAVVLFLLAGSPVFAQPSATDNVVTRFIWFLTRMAFYGTGAAIVLLGIIIPIGKKVLSGQRSDTNPVVNILWAVGLFAAPSLLQLGYQWFNSNQGAAGALSEMNMNSLNPGGSGGGGSSQ